MGDRIVWQIAAGAADRRYSDVFLKYGVGLIGLGWPGPWKPGLPDEDFEGRFVRQLASETKEGDALLLREGIASIRAIGLVAGDYQYFPQFEDIEGWDLQHGRRVRWRELPQRYDFETSVFGGNPSRLSRSWNPDVNRYVDGFLSSPPTDWQTGPLPNLPVEEVALDQVPEYMADVVATVRDLTPLFWDQQRFGAPPREDELLVHIVGPLLRALGWPVELIAIKWNNIDIAIFGALPRTAENVQFVIEAKRLGKGFTFALEQAQGYLAQLGITRDIVVTDGIRYRLYASNREFEAAAYANLSTLKQSATHLLDRLRRTKPTG